MFLFKNLFLCFGQEVGSVLLPAMHTTTTTSHPHPATTMYNTYHTYPITHCYPVLPALPTYATTTIFHNTYCHTPTLYHACHLFQHTCHAFATYAYALAVLLFLFDMDDGHVKKEGSFWSRQWVKPFPCLSTPLPPSLNHLEACLPHTAIVPV